MAIGRTNAGGGGGGGLNFKVVGGTTAPTSPKENTIWVNTGVDIPSWAFSATEPGSPVEGMVWISTGTSSAVAFNALKKNDIQVYPISAKQYVSSQWVSVEAKSYQGSEWHDFVLLTFYKEGVQYVNFTDYSDNTSNALTFGESYVTITAPKNKGNHMFSVENIDIRLYKEIYVIYANLQGTNAQAQIKIMSDDGTSLTRAYRTDANGTVSVDVSNISQPAHVAAMVYGPSTETSMHVLEIGGVLK